MLTLPPRLGDCCSENDFKITAPGRFVIPLCKRRNGNVNFRVRMDTERRVHSSMVRLSAADGAAVQYA